MCFECAGKHRRAGRAKKSDEHSRVYGAMQQIVFERARDYADALSRAAEECGVEREYWDIFHYKREASCQACGRILEALGWDTATFESLERERASRFEDQFTSLLAKTAVISESEKRVMLTLGVEDAVASICFEIVLENGERLAGSIETPELRVLRRVLIEGREWAGYELALPAELPLGYHLLKISRNGKFLGESKLIVCPDRAYIDEALARGERTAGFNVALYGLRSERNWGCGDFSDLRPLCEWARNEIGFSFIGLNPLHALHNRVPYNTSPYLPLSMFYKNLIYIDVEALPEFKSSHWAQELFRSRRVQEMLDRLRGSEFVAYQEVDRLKRRFLKILFREFRASNGASSARRRAFVDYCETEGDLLDEFALYCALDEFLHKRNRNCWIWGNWAPEYQDPESAACRSFAADHSRSVDFYKYIQFVIEEQLAEAQNYATRCGMQIGLYHDLAVATDSYGSDLWAHRDFYVNGCRVGAPPDEFSPGGQDWSFPPPNSRKHREGGYRLFRESIRKAARHAGALRIDHVMRLFRLFWIPEGSAPAGGTYVRDYASDLLHVLALESVRSKTMIIGEDLGTVTGEIREALGRFGILSYRLLYFEKNFQDGSFRSSYEYPRQALVGSSTHDLPTIAGFWSFRDVEARKAAGLIEEGAYWRQIEDRRREKQRLLARLHAEDLLPSYYPRNAEHVREVDGDLHNAIIGFLAQTPSMILLLNHEDFTLETEQQNLPGSTAEYPNWQRKMKVKIEDLRSEALQGYVRMFRDQLARTGRCA
jgi:4-alpha-glucanotransferase